MSQSYAIDFMQMCPHTTPITKKTPTTFYHATVIYSHSAPLLNEYNTLMIILNVGYAPSKKPGPYWYSNRNIYGKPLQDILITYANERSTHK